MQTVATDIGGTFTDLVRIDEATGELAIAKASTTPQDLPQGVLDAVAEAGLDPASIDQLVHGTTVVINAITQRSGSVTALVTTRGFRDVLEIGRGNRPDMYNLVSRKPEPFVPRRRRFQVSERVDRHGAVLLPLALEELDAVAEACTAQGVEAVAVCLLHAYAFPEHELRVAARLRELLPGVTVSTSSEITREWREYERTSTTVLNAYVQPTVERYLGNLHGALGRRGFAGRLQVMRSNAGTASLEAARSRPIALVESGPAAGVVGAARIGTMIGEPNVLYLDVGGTTAKCSLIEGGVPRTTTTYRVEWTPESAGYPIMVPVVDIVEIGAGGGSIAWVDEGGALRIGPRSAGAEPGPACYGRGGEEPTVTDAKLVAGVIDPDYFLGGAIHLDRGLAEQALARLGERYGQPAAAMANGVIRVANAATVEALKLVSVRRGYDPRDFVLVVGGGGGPMHAAALAAELHVRRVVVPPLCGVFSAWGMCLTDPRFDAILTGVTRTAAVDDAWLAERLDALEREAVAHLREDGNEGEPTVERSIDMRYRGQEHAVRVPVAAGRPSLPAIEQAFHAEHRRAYTFELPDESVELVTFHVSASVSRAAPLPPAPPVSGSPRPKGERMVDFDVDGVHRTAVYERSQLPAGFVAAGPLVVEEPTTTTLVHPGQRLSVDTIGNLLLDLGA